MLPSHPSATAPPATRTPAKEAKDGDDDAAEGRGVNRTEGNHYVASPFSVGTERDAQKEGGDGGKNRLYLIALIRMCFAVLCCAVLCCAVLCVVL